MKITNLVIHILTGISLFTLSLLLLSHLNKDKKTNNQLIALIVFSIWILHPFQLTSVAYIVQRMTSLSALFSVLAIIAYTFGRLRLINGQSNGWIWILFCMPLIGILGVLSKENAALLPFYLFCIEFCLFNFSTRTKRDKHYLKVFFALIIAIPFLLLLIFIFTQSSWFTSGYHNRDFTLIERVLTQSRILLWYLQMILIPDISQMSLFLDDIQVSRALTKPIATLPSCITIIVLISSALIFRKTARLVSFAILWFFFWALNGINNYSFRNGIRT